MTRNKSDLHVHVVASSQEHEKPLRVTVTITNTIYGYVVAATRESEAWDATVAGLTTEAHDEAQNMMRSLMLWHKSEEAE